jgi:hypothetical protein
MPPTSWQSIPPVSRGRHPAGLAAGPRLSLRFVRPTAGQPRPAGKREPKLRLTSPDNRRHGTSIAGLDWHFASDFSSELQDADRAELMTINLLAFKRHPLF